MRASEITAYFAWGIGSTSKYFNGSQFIRLNKLILILILFVYLFIYRNITSIDMI